MAAEPLTKSLPRDVEKSANRWSLPGTSMPLGLMVRRSVEGLRQHSATVHAGNIAFRLLFAFFPALIALHWALRALHADGMIGALSDIFGTIIPGTASEPLKQQVQDAPKPQQDGHFS